MAPSFGLRMAFRSTNMVLPFGFVIQEQKKKPTRKLRGGFDFIVSENTMIWFEDTQRERV